MPTLLVPMAPHTTRRTSTTPRSACSCRRDASSPRPTRTNPAGGRPATSTPTPPRTTSSPTMVRSRIRTRLGSSWRQRGAAV